MHLRANRLGSPAAEHVIPSDEPVYVYLRYENASVPPEKRNIHITIPYRTLEEVSLRFKRESSGLVAGARHDHLAWSLPSEHITFAALAYCLHWAEEQGFPLGANFLGNKFIPPNLEWDFDELCAVYRAARYLELSERVDISRLRRTMQQALYTDPIDPEKIKLIWWATESPSDYNLRGELTKATVGFAYHQDQFLSFQESFKSLPSLLREFNHAWSGKMARINHAAARQRMFDEVRAEVERNHNQETDRGVRLYEI